MTATEPAELADDGIERLLKVQEVASRLGVSTATVWRMLKDDEFIEPVMLGKLTRWRVRDFNAWVAARQNASRGSRKE
jgi:excisionase family DNA binding protein